MDFGEEDLISDTVKDRCIDPPRLLLPFHMLTAVTGPYLIHNGPCAKGEKAVQGRRQPNVTVLPDTIFFFLFLSLVHYYFSLRVFNAHALSSGACLSEEGAERAVPRGSEKAGSRLCLLVGLLCTYYTVDLSGGGAVESEAM